MSSRPVLVQPISQQALLNERRGSERHAASIEALTRPLEAQDTLWWGAVVRDISTTGLGLSLCYPFRPGTYLAVDVQSASGGGRTFLTRVIHVQDKADGTWHLGCEFVKKLTDSDLEMII